MFQVGPLELLVVGIIALLVLGPARLPDAAKAMGRGMREFRSALDGGDDQDEDDRRKRSDERDLD
jgi:sec-independent protein translocase protein TatA